MADFRLTQTGEQIQAILNQQPLDHTELDGHVTNSVIHVTRTKPLEREQQTCRRYSLSDFGGGGGGSAYRTTDPRQRPSAAVQHRQGAYRSRYSTDFTASNALRLLCRLSNRTQDSRDRRSVRLICSKNRASRLSSQLLIQVANSELLRRETYSRPERWLW